MGSSGLASKCLGGLCTSVCKVKGTAQMCGCVDGVASEMGEPPRLGLAQCFVMAV